MKKEYVIWGIPKNESNEVLLITEYQGKKLTDIGDAEDVKLWLTIHKGCKDVRIQTIDFSEPVDFTKTINK